jgi:hypothetical protein
MTFLEICLLNLHTIRICLKTTHAACNCWRLEDGLQKQVHGLVRMFHEKDRAEARCLLF